MENEYEVSSLEQLIPTKTSRWLLSLLAISLLHALYRFSECLIPISEGIPISMKTLWYLSGSLFSSLVLAVVIIIDLALLFKRKKHSKIIHHHVKSK